MLRRSLGVHSNTHNILNKAGHQILRYDVADAELVSGRIRKIADTSGWSANYTDLIQDTIDARPLRILLGGNWWMRYVQGYHYITSVGGIVEPDNPQEITMSYVHYNAQATNGQYILKWGNNTNTRIVELVQFKDSSGYRYRAKMVDQDGHSAYVYSSYLSSPKAVITVRMDQGTSLEMWVNDDYQSVSATSLGTWYWTQSSAGKIAIPATSDVSSGMFGEMIAYDALLDDDTLAAVHQYLRDKWGI